jgi:hypothetical protein
MHQGSSLSETVQLKQPVAAGVYTLVISNSNGVVSKQKVIFEK